VNNIFLPSVFGIKCVTLKQSISYITLTHSKTYIICKRIISINFLYGLFGARNAFILISQKPDIWSSVIVSKIFRIGQ
jgi:hypothetical protein